MRQRPIDSLRPRLPLFHYQRNYIYLRFCHADYHKGAALAELSRLTGIARDAIFAAGDNYNDIPMLDGRYAKFNACPANAVAAVKDTVRAAGGVVSQQPHSAGVVESRRDLQARGQRFQALRVLGRGDQLIACDQPGVDDPGDQTLAELPRAQDGDPAQPLLFHRTNPVKVRIV